MSSGYNESDISAGAADIHRALASFQEELEAVDYYQQRMEKTSDSELRAVLEHNRNEEIEHATMLFEWLRRTMPEFDTQAKTYLFSKGPLSEVEEAAEAAGETPESDGGEGVGLGIGNLK